jgi:hypothetical protein
MRKSAFTVRRETVDLAALTQDVALRYKGTAQDAGLTLHVKTDAGGSAIADNDRVLQVVSNLVENAIRCTPPPGTVTITTAPGTVAVSDTGRGLTSDDLPGAVGVGTAFTVVLPRDDASPLAAPSSTVAPSTVATPQDVSSSTAALPRDDAS